MLSMIPRLQTHNLQTSWWSCRAEANATGSVHSSPPLGRAQSGPRHFSNAAQCACSCARHSSQRMTPGAEQRGWRLMEFFSYWKQRPTHTHTHCDYIIENVLYESSANRRTNVWVTNISWLRLAEENSWRTLFEIWRMRSTHSLEWQIFGSRDKRREPKTLAALRLVSQENV